MSAPDELWGVIDDNGHPVMVRVSEQRVREYVALTKDVIGMTYEVVRYVRAPTAPQGAEPVAYRTQLASGTWLVCAAGEKLEQDWRAIEGVDLQPLYTAPQGAEIAREALRELIAWLRERQMEVQHR